MHEVGIIDEMVHELLHRVEAMSGDNKVLKVYVKLGKDSHLTEESFCMLFESMANGTALEGVEIDITLVDGGAVTIDTLEVE